MWITLHAATFFHRTSGKRSKIVSEQLVSASQNNASVYKPLISWLFLPKRGIAVLEQLPCWPDLADCQFIFPSSRRLSKNPFSRHENLQAGMDDEAGKNLENFFAVVHGRMKGRIVRDFKGMY